MAWLGSLAEADEVPRDQLQWQQWGSGKDTGSAELAIGLNPLLPVASIFYLKMEMMLPYLPPKIVMKVK